MINAIKKLFQKIKNAFKNAPPQGHESPKGGTVTPPPPPPPDFDKPVVVVGPTPPKPPEKANLIPIKNHKFEGVRYIQDPDMGGPMVPKVVLLHHTVSYDLEGTISWFKEESVDIHILIDRDGTICQMVPFNRQAAHAGTSSFKGYSGLNKYAIGIEFLNLGPLTKSGNKYFDYYGREYKGPVRARDAEGYKYWEPFTEAQEKAALSVVTSICKEYDIPANMVTGHYVASPGRKNDPAGGFSEGLDKFVLDIKSQLEL